MAGNIGSSISAGKEQGQQATYVKPLDTKLSATPMEYEVETIQDVTKDDDGVSWYFVKWKGYPDSENTWEPVKNLEGCAKLIRKYHKGNKRDKLNRSEYKRKRNECDGANHKKKKPKQASTDGLITPVDLSSQRKNVQRALRQWQKKLNEVCTDKGLIIVENHVDLEGPPKGFTYINDYKPGPGITIPTDPLVGCDCTRCSPAHSTNCCPHKSSAPFAYTKGGLIKVPPGKPVYECNVRCKCSKKCFNRVVQNGRQKDVAVFRTSNGRGWGVRTLTVIKKNSFVMEYVGEVITNEEAERRGQVYDANGRTYLFDLDYNDGDCPFTVDAGVFGNVSHFVNHSCDPNLVVYGVWVNTLDPRLPRIALFASQDIQAGEELTFDYQMTGELNTSGSSTTLQPIMCRCNSKNCRSFLF